MHQSLFIVIEGLDGSGKTTASAELARQLEAVCPSTVKRTAEPHEGSCGGILLRQILAKQETNFDPHFLPIGFATNRLDHSHRHIKPWLAGGEGRVVICDRYYLSSLVYQSDAETSFEKIMLLNEHALKPDVMFFINVDTKTCYERMQNRNQPEELFERNLDETRRKYSKAIKFLREKHGDRIVEIDGSGRVAETVAQMRAAIEALDLIPPTAPFSE
jgi:dTMP kinase